MKQRFTRFFATAIGAALVAVTTVVGASALSVSNVPLFVTQGVQPNVMILFDDSGSMHNLLWSTAYNPSTIYPNWSVGVSCTPSTGAYSNTANINTLTFVRQNGVPCYSQADTENFDFNWDDVTASNIYPSDSCPSGYFQGRKVVLASDGVTPWTPPAGNYATQAAVPSVIRITKCIKFPDPLSFAPDSEGAHSTWYQANYLNFVFENATSTFSDSTANNACRNNVTFGTSTTTCRTYADINFGGVAPTTATVTAGGLTIPNNSRIGAARTVSKQVVTNNPTLRFGLTILNSSEGGTVKSSCGTSTTTLNSTIDTLRAVTSTPLAETFYEITRYFRGAMTSNYSSAITNVAGEPAIGDASSPKKYISPIQYRCQQNFTIVVTDGYPTNDINIPTTDPADVADASHALPDWDGLAPASTQAMFDTNTLPHFSDGTVSGGQGNEGYSLYMDDIAKFAFDTDMRKAPDVDAQGISFDDPNFPKQNLETITIGLSLQNFMLQDASFYGGNNGAYSASDEAQLSQALQLAVNEVLAKTSSASSVATNSTRLTANSFIYQARFSTGDWSGQLLAFQLAADGSVAASPSWNASTVLPASGSRSIFSFKPGTGGVAFQTLGTLSAADQLALNTNVASVVDGKGQLRIDYLRGDGSSEAPNANNFRPRSNKLGDIVNSDPAFVGNQDLGYGNLPGSEGSTYNAYITSGAAFSRAKMVYVGANDGMLHAFNAANGVEVFAYVPELIIPNLKYLTDINYNQNHKYFVDGSPATSDAYIGGAWATYVVGALGAGGKGVFALDVTNPASFTTSNVKWEFTDTDMGLSIPGTTIARMNDGNWAAIVPNGYNSTSEKAVLYVVNLGTGAIIKKFDTGAAGSNGLSGASPVDANGDGIADFIYAGDLLGNMWKFDVQNASPSNWFIMNNAGTPAGTPVIPLSVACDGTSSTGTPATACTVRQPITTRPEATINPRGGFVVLFGTGRYFVAGDNNTAGAQTQSFYGIKDKNLASGQTTIFGRANLQQQTIITTATVSGKTVRATSNNSVSDTQDGWYLDLPAGEKQVATPQVRSGRIIFTTLIPNTDPCGFGGDSFVYELDALTGSRLKYAAFDVNGDGNFDQGDFIDIGGGVMVPASGLKSTEGIIKTPTCLSSGGAKEYCYASGTSGKIFSMTGNLGPGTGRQSWRQLQ